MKYPIVSFHCQNPEVRAMNKKAVFAFAVLLIVLLLVGAAIVDAKSKGGGGGRSGGSSSKGFSSALSSSSAKDTVAKAVGISAIPMLTKSTKKKTHVDADDAFENESFDNETADAQEAPKSPGSGILPFSALCLLHVAWRSRHRP